MGRGYRSRVTTERESIKLAERIELWQSRLARLGIGHWRIDAVHVDDETPGGPRANATVRPSYHYDSCEFWFKHDYVDNASEAELDETIIHEWLHVFMRDFDRAVESVEDQLAAAVRDIWDEHVDHEREQLIEAMARQIYELWEKVVH